MNVFLTLVKNDIGIARNYKKHSFFWRMLYIALALIVGIIIYTVQLMNGKITPQIISIIPALLLFSPFPTAINLIKREWQGNTVGWWLQLPHSRKMLLGAKFTAGFIRYLRTVLIIFIISTLLWLEGVILRPETWGLHSPAGDLGQLFKVYIQMLSVSPVLIVFGMLTVILRNTRFSHTIPIFWVLYGGIMSVFFSTFFRTAFNSGTGFAWAYNIPGMSTGTTLALGILAMLAIAVIMFLFTSFLMEKYVEI